MMTWLKYGTATVLVLIVLAFGTAWWLLRGSLPALDGEIRLAGLATTVTVTHDALGVVTIEAQSQADAMRALGFVHGQVRSLQMDVMRRLAAGEMSELFGPATVTLDRTHRVHRLRERVGSRLDELPPDQRAIATAYAEGVNAGLRALDVRPWPYLLLGAEPEPWAIADSMLVGYAIYFMEQDQTNERELALWRIKAHVPSALFKLYTHRGSIWDAPIRGKARGSAKLPDAATLNLQELPAPPTGGRSVMPRAAPVGSNNFAVAGSLTRHGHALVANDMHMPLQVPNIWFRARLRYPDPRAPAGQVDVTGFTLPGVPGVLVGSNGHVAWGYTNGYGDWLDWKWLPPCPEDTDCREVRAYRERIKVDGAPAEFMDVAETDWGPILHRNPDGSALALRWVAHLPGSLNFGFLDFAHAGSVAEMLEIADRTAMSAQNMVIGDREGHIAWTLLGPVPLRNKGCVASPVGNDAGIEGTATCTPWSVTSDTDLQLVNPASGRLWSANARVVDGKMLQRIGNGGYVLGARARQIRDDLFAREHFDEAGLLAIQLDLRAVFMERWWRLLQSLAAKQDAPVLDRLAAAAKHWDGRAATDSASYRLVRAWYVQIHDRIADGLTAPARAALGEHFKLPHMYQLESVVWPLVTQRPAHLLPRRYGSWPELFEDAAAQVVAELDAPLSERTWGERNTIHICHPIAKPLPDWLKTWLCLPSRPMPGDFLMPRVQSPGFGAAERMVVAPGRERQGITHMPGGQSGHPLSPFWGLGHEAWVRGEPTPFLPGPPEYVLMLHP